jgi:hypothetical protein
LGLGFAGCGDDVNIGSDMAPDLTATVHDMAMNADLQPDMAMALATAQLTLADIGGTFYKPGATAGTESAVPFAHLLFAQQSLGIFASNPQYIDSDFSTKAGMIHGCTANRYNLAGGPIPNPDADAGIISYTGYNTALLSADARTAPGTLYAPPIPTNIVCAWGGATLPFYGCVFGGPSTDQGTSIEGDQPSQALFPPFPPAAVGMATCPAGTTSHTGIPVVGTLCEQHPIPDGQMITQAIAGNSNVTNGYGAIAPQMIPISGGLGAPMTVINVAGAAPANPGDPLGGAITLDGSADLTITWSCDGSTTVGNGCPTGAAGFLDLAGLLTVVSTAPRSQFAITPQYGTAQCAEQLGTGTVTLKKAAITQMIGTQTGGSVLIALVRLSANPQATMGHNVYLTAGKGYFGLQTH